MVFKLIYRQPNMHTYVPAVHANFGTLLFRSPDGAACNVVHVKMQGQEQLPEPLTL
jgi:hypothetical protein